MSSELLNALVQYGAHAGVYDLTTAPSSTIHVQPEGPVVFNRPKNPLERDFVTADNERLPAVEGRQPPNPLPDLTFLCYGQADGGSANGESSTGAGKVTETDDLYEAHIGTEDGDSGDTLGSGTPHTAGSTTVTMDGAVSGVSDGILFLFPYSGGYSMRQVVSTSGSNFGLSQAPTDLDGTDVALTADGVAYAARCYHVEQLTSGRTLLQFDAESQNWRTVYNGCLGSLTWNVNDEGYLTVTASGIMVCNYKEDTAQANPTYSTPTRGSPIIAETCSLVLDGNTFLTSNLSVALNIESAFVPSTTAANNRAGIAVRRVRPVISGRMRAGTNTDPHEVTEALFETWTGDTGDVKNLYRLDLLVGSNPGAAMGFSMNQAEVTGQLVEDDGFLAFDFEARPVAPASADVSYGMTIGVF